MDLSFQSQRTYTLRYNGCDLSISLCHSGQMPSAFNQRDNGEIETQGQLVRRVYTSAYLVVADLGEAGDLCDDDAAVFNALMHIAKTTADYEQIVNERCELFGLSAYL